MTLFLFLTSDISSCLCPGEGWRVGPVSDISSYLCLGEGWRVGPVSCSPQSSRSQNHRSWTQPKRGFHYLLQGCRSRSAWIRIHFPSRIQIRVRIQYADCGSGSRRENLYKKRKDISNTIIVILYKFFKYCKFAQAPLCFLLLINLYIFQLQKTFHTVR